MSRPPGVGVASPRVGVVGYMHEVNALADPVTLGDGLQTAETPGGLESVWEAGAVITRLRELRPVEIVEFPVWEFGASGPLVDDDFRTMLDGTVRALRAAGPLDAVAVAGHGAGRTVTDLDADATFLRAVRAVVGAVPLVAVLDFHANVSPAMVDLCDVIVGYRTNPHIDIVERLREAGDHLHRLLDTPGTVRARCRLPMVLPQIAQLTTPGEPLGEVSALADSLRVAPIRNISVFGGFSLGDVPDCGVSVCVTADQGHEQAAADAATELARLAWSLRPQYRLHCTGVAQAVDRAAQAASGECAPVILADTADNPGGGAPGNTTFLLRALTDAGVNGVVMGLQCDRGVVDSAWEAGVGAIVRVVFNEGSTRPLATPFAADATVMALADGVFVPTRGVYEGANRYPGRCCALDLGGIRIGVSSH
ncbi:MAG: M81 family metallopeptidase, partial [Actinobacteria bacterium]|nr:M81 family metallopeptidase [Actinomycetota bacterium]